MAFDIDIYKKAVSELNFGKRIGYSLYVEVESLRLKNYELLGSINSLIKQISIKFEYNIIKFITNKNSISYLNYKDFWKEPHPILRDALNYNFENENYKIRRYDDSKNPPILHRKETFLHPKHPLIRKFKALTIMEENSGLYENPAKIGFKKQWERLLREKCLRYQGHLLIRIKDYKLDNNDVKAPVKVKRHKTAIKRYNFSKPIQAIQEHELLNDTSRIFDYGCGKGDDVKALQKLGYNAVGWDPVYRPDEETPCVRIVVA